MWVADFILDLLATLQAELQSLNNTSNRINYSSNFFWFFICPKLAQITPEDLP
jgi:hypothetical protein